MEEGAAYLRTNVVDPTDGALEVAGMDQLPDVHPLLDGNIGDAALEVGLFCKEFSCAGKPLGDEEVKYDKVDVTESQVSTSSYTDNWQKNDKSNQLQVNIFSSLSFGEIPNLVQDHHAGQGADK